MFGKTVPHCTFLCICSFGARSHRRFLVPRLGVTTPLQLRLYVDSQGRVATSLRGGGVGHSVLEGELLNVLDASLQAEEACTRSLG